jgi:hypothetical protein
MPKNTTSSSQAMFGKHVINSLHNGRNSFRSEVRGSLMPRHQIYNRVNWIGWSRTFDLVVAGRLAQFSELKQLSIFHFLQLFS